MTERRYNIRAYFKRGKLDRLEAGDFGPVTDADRDNAIPRELPVNDDCLIAWPTDPEFTGPLGVAMMLGCPVSDHFWASPSL